tara:strand:+ start:785 stop:1249 length:465 start_codon:yes stop_codon:yes gene_type:complete
MIAYLSGGMENAPKEGSKWRIEMNVWLKTNLGHDVIDPVVESKKVIEKHNAEDYRSWKKTKPKVFKQLIRKLINQDLNAVVNNVDYLIVLWDESVIKGGGTHGEVTVAYWMKKPIYLVNKLDMDDLSAWILSCSTDVYKSFDELKIALMKEYSS